MSTKKTNELDNKTSFTQSRLEQEKKDKEDEKVAKKIMPHLKGRTYERAQDVLTAVSRKMREQAILP